MENQSNDYNIEYGLYSEPGAPNYDERIEACSKVLRNNEVLKSDKTQGLKNLDGKVLKKLETLNYEKDFKNRKTEYLKLVTENNSFINPNNEDNEDDLTQKKTTRPKKNDMITTGNKKVDKKY